MSVYRTTGLVALMASSLATANTNNPARIGPDLSSRLSALTGGAQVKMVWVQKQFISDDSTRYLECGTDVTMKWLYNGGGRTKLVGFDSKEGTGRVLDSTTGTHVKPIIDRSGRYIIWNDTEANRSWVMSWDGQVKKPLLTGGEYLVPCTWYDKSTGKMYLYAASKGAGANEQLLEMQNLYRYEFDLSSASVVTSTKTLMWNRSRMHAPFTVAADGVHAAGNAPWPHACFMRLPNDSIGYVQRSTGQETWACHVNIAPDASLRLFHMEETHTRMAIYPPSRTNPSWISLVSKLPGADPTSDCNAPRWTNDIRYLTVFAPYTYWKKGAVTTHDCTKPVMATPWKEGESGEFYFGKFNSDLTDVEFIRVTDGDWRYRKIMGDAWVSTGEGPEQSTAAFIERRWAPASHRNRTDLSQSGRGFSPTSVYSVRGERLGPVVRTTRSGVFVMRSDGRSGLVQTVAVNRQR